MQSHVVADDDFVLGRLTRSRCLMHRLAEVQSVITGDG